MLDAFNRSMFNTVSLTAAINKMPYQPGLVSQAIRWQMVPIRTTTAVIEERDGKLAVLPTAARGTMPTAAERRNRRTRSFVVPHIPHNDAVMADEVQNVRAFGSENRLETVVTIVNQKLQQMRQDHENTFEWHKLGAVKGVILDADGSTVIYNLFTEFGISQDTTDFLLGTTTTDIKGKCTQVLRNLESAIGQYQVSQPPIAFCGDTFWDKLVVHPKVEAAYERWRDGQLLRDNQLYTGFEYAGIFFIRYRGGGGGATWIGANDAYCVPRDIPGLFQHIMAPADFIETVNTLGRRIYVKQRRMPYDKGIELHSQSNPLMMCTRPKALQKLTTSN